MEARRTLDLLAELLKTRGVHFRAGERYGVATQEGETFVLDPNASVVVSTVGWTEDLAARIFTNEKTLADLAKGTFDPTRPGPGHIFLFEGNDGALDTLHRALTAGRSAVQIRSGGDP